MATKVTINDRVFEIFYAGSIAGSNSHRKIKVTLWYRGRYSDFYSITTRLDLIEYVIEMQKPEERYASFYSIIVEDIADSVTSWAESIDEQEREDDSLPGDSVAGAMDEANN